MSAKFLSRLVVVVVFGVLLGLGRHQIAERYYLKGREAFIAEHARNWDRFYAHPHHIVTGIIVNIVLAAVVVGVYELLVCGLSRLFRGTRTDEKRS